MTMRPEDVRATRFREGWRGYDEDEVDDFMSRVAHALQVVIDERDEAVERADRLARDAEGVVENERLLRRTLLTAERTAEETVQRAQMESDRIRSEARAEAERLRIDAHDRARLQLQQAAETSERIRRAIEEFRAFRGDYLDRVRAVIAEHLAAVERVGDVPGVPDQVADFERLDLGADDGGGGLPTSTADDTPSVLSVDDLDDPGADDAGVPEPPAAGSPDAASPDAASRASGETW